MLPKSRIVSALVLGLGVALLVGAIIAPRFITADARLPLDMDPVALTITLRDEAAQTRLEGDPEKKVVTGGITKQIHASIQPPTSADAATLRVGTTTMRESYQSDLDRLVSAAVWTFMIDRNTGEFRTPLTLTSQLASPTAVVEAEGGWLKFPTQAKQTAYDIFDQTLRRTVPAQFVEETTEDGRTLYRYRQTIRPTTVALPGGGFGLTTLLPGPNNTTEPGYLFHSVVRDFLVDQESGLIVEVSEKLDDYYATGDGVKREQVLLFNGTTSREYRDAVLAVARELPDPQVAGLVRKGVGAFGALLIVFGLAGAFGVWRRFEKDPASAETTPNVEDATAVPAAAAGEERGRRVYERAEHAATGPVGVGSAAAAAAAATVSADAESAAVNTARRANVDPRAENVGLAELLERAQAVVGNRAGEPRSAVVGEEAGTEDVTERESDEPAERNTVGDAAVTPVATAEARTPVEEAVSRPVSNALDKDGGYAPVQQPGYDAATTEMPVVKEQP